jgi:hypothetical protein
MQDTLSDEKEFSGLIISGANAALLLRVLQLSRGGISLARNDGVKTLSCSRYVTLNQT